MKLKLTFITITVLLLSIIHTKAQNNTVTYTQSHLQAAERVVKVSGLEDNMAKMFDQVMDVQSNQLPEGQRDAFKQVMKKFLDKYVNPTEIRKAFIPIYASEFTEQELNEIADFLSTPTGKDMTSKQSDLFQKGGAWGMQVVQAHQAELEQMLKDAIDSKN